MREHKYTVCGQHSSQSVICALPLFGVALHRARPLHQRQHDRSDLSHALRAGSQKVQGGHGLATGAGRSPRIALERLVTRVSRRVTGGMLFATVLGLLMIPVFYASVRRVPGDKLDEVLEKRRHDDEDDRIEAPQK
jgi:hypothetical protein